MIDVTVICGPTASGKTAYSLELAKRQDIEIISADSRQVYKYLNIGTAKPDYGELSAVNHHFIDYINPDENYSAGLFGDQAYSTIIDIANRGKTPVVVGGSGLYIKALCEGLFEEEKDVDISIRNDLMEKLKNEGIDFLYNHLQHIDKSLYNLYSDKNPRRVIRALEYYYQNGTRLSDAHTNKSNRDCLNIIYYMIDYPRNILYERINLRVEQMWESGLVSETETVLNMGFSPSLNSLNTVGYKETIAYLNGEYSKDNTINEIQKNTRHYAKRQLTWFRKIPNIKLIETAVC